MFRFHALGILEAGVLRGFPGGFRLRVRSWITAGAAAALAAFLILYPRHRAAPPAPAATDSGARAPSSPPLAAPESPRFCQNAYRAVCQRRGDTRDPTGVVRPDVDGEIQALRTYEEIIHEHPDWSSEQVDEELVKTIFTPQRRDRVQSAYRYVQHALEAFIDRQPESVFTAHEKKALKQRIRKTQLELPPPVSVYADEPDLFTKNDVFYERTVDGQLRMRVGGAYLLTAKSWFNILFTLGHELGHSIDPCEVRSARLSFPAYDRLTACFMRSGLVAVRKSRTECGDNDQLSETFADWIAVQVVSEALKHFATEFHGPQLLGAATNAVRDLCEQDEGSAELDLELHPPPQVRIDRIFARHPAIREVMGCAPQPESPAYCDFEFNVAEHPAAPASTERHF